MALPFLVRDDSIIGRHRWPNPRHWAHPRQTPDHRPQPGSQHDCRLIAKAALRVIVIGSQTE